MLWKGGFDQLSMKPTFEKFKKYAERFPNKGQPNYNNNKIILLKTITKRLSKTLKKIDQWYDAPVRYNICYSVAPNIPLLLIIVSNAFSNLFDIL